MTHKERLYNALKSEQEAKINEALLTLDLCFNNQTAIGEHTSEHFVKEASKKFGSQCIVAGLCRTHRYYLEEESKICSPPKWLKPRKGLSS